MQRKGQTMEAMKEIARAVSRSSVNNIRTKTEIPVWAGKYKNVSMAENRYA